MNLALENKDILFNISKIGLGTNVEINDKMKLAPKDCAFHEL